MFQVGQPVTGKFVKLTTYRDKPADPLLSHISGAFFDIGNGKWARLPIKHALEEYSDGMTRRRLARMKVGHELPFEIIGADVQKKKTFLSISEKMAAAREMLDKPDQPKKLWTVTVTETHRFVGKGLKVEFPSGFRTYAHQAWLGLGDRIGNIRAGEALIVKLGGVSLCDDKWFLHMSVADPKHYPDHEVVKLLPLSFLFATMLSSASPDQASDFIKHVTADGDSQGG